jgi:hypothetical protein
VLLIYRLYSFEPDLTSIEELVYSLLASLPRSSLVNVQNEITPLLQLDVVGVRLLFIVQTSFNLTRFTLVTSNRGRLAYLLLPPIKDPLILWLSQPALAHSR